MPTPHLQLQRLIIKQIVKGTDDEFAKFIAKGLQWWLKEDEASDVAEDLPLAELVVKQLKAGSRQLPQHIVAAFLKSIANAWITYSMATRQQ